MKLPIEITEEEFRAYHDDGGGICLECGEFAENVEPDARDYQCDSCEQWRVFGLDEALMAGHIVFGPSFEKEE